MSNRIVAVLVFLIGIAHLAAGYRAFVDPTEPRVWFVSAGFLLITTGLANFAAGTSACRSHSIAALSGGLAILLLGGLLGVADPALLAAPQTAVLVGAGLFLSIMRVRDISAKRPAPERAA